MRGHGAFFLIPRGGLTGRAKWYGRKKTTQTISERQAIYQGNKKRHGTTPKVTLAKVTILEED